MQHIPFALPSLLVSPNSHEGQQARQCIRRCAKAIGKASMRPTGVVFGIDDAFHPQASKLANAKALRALLDCLIDLDLICLEAFPKTLPLYKTGVFYRLMPNEAPWETIPTLYHRGFGDCKSLAACRIAEVRRQGQTAIPVFRHVTSGWGTMFHILILHGDGSWECPSKLLGMKVSEERVRP